MTFTMTAKIYRMTKLAETFHHNGHQDGHHDGHEHGVVHCPPVNKFIFLCVLLRGKGGGKEVLLHKVWDYMFPGGSCQ